MRKNLFSFSSLFALLLLLPLCIALYDIVSGNISFWYDPARDLLQALGNIHKLTLIGPPSGIPGIFYGPYWIWLLSLGLVISKDPRFITFLVSFIPYFIIFPIILYKHLAPLDKKITFILLPFFLFGYGIHYGTALWNPHPAALIFLTLLYLIMITDYKSLGKETYFKMLLTGLMAGILINFHISFGLGALVGVGIFFISDIALGLLQNKNQTGNYIMRRLLLLSIFGCGLLTSLTPFFAFEYRHGFNQIHTALGALSKFGGVVALKGLSNGQILSMFYGKLAILLGTNTPIAYGIGIICTFLVLYGLKSKRFVLTPLEKKLAILLLSISSGILLLYLTARNPVWDYHFLGVEIIFLMALALFGSKSALVKKILMVWVIIICASNSLAFYKSINQNHLVDSSLSVKEKVVDTIIKDAGAASYTVFDHSPSIYQYDYSYLFKWKADKDVPYDPGTIQKDAPAIYLIMTNVSSDDQRAFLGYRTPEANYKTSRQWTFQGNTKVIKRSRVTN
ncbi:MAG: hypothetical protein ACMG6E_01375 [Candidatus Roizmanbacteria bacterium]